jgi:hypothetical protein
VACVALSALAALAALDFSLYQMETNRERKHTSLSKYQLTNLAYRFQTFFKNIHTSTSRERTRVDGSRRQRRNSIHCPNPASSRYDPLPLLGMVAQISAADVRGLVDLSTYTSDDKCLEASPRRSHMRLIFPALKMHCGEVFYVFASGRVVECINTECFSDDDEIRGDRLKSNRK